MCDVKDCPREGTHKTKLVCPAETGILATDANLCDMHWNIIKNGGNSKYSIGCSIKKEKDIDN